MRILKLFSMFCLWSRRRASRSVSRVGRDEAALPTARGFSQYLVDLREELIGRDPSEVVHPLGVSRAVFLREGDGRLSAFEVEEIRSVSVHGGLQARHTGSERGGR